MSAHNGGGRRRHVCAQRRGPAGSANSILGQEPAALEGIGSPQAVRRPAAGGAMAWYGLLLLSLENPADSC